MKNEERNGNTARDIREKQTSLRFHCIHPNCKKSFKDEIELRAHLIAYNPGMAAENQFLRDSVLSLLNYAAAMASEASTSHTEVTRLL